MLYYTKTVQQSLTELNASEHGLAVSEAAERLRIYGSNTIRVTGDPLWRKLIEPFANVFMVVLLLAAGISILRGDVLDAAIIGFIMIASVGVYYVQRFSTERILRSLQRHSAQAVSVFRDGTLIEVDASLLVPGDVISLSEGEKIPADARIIHSSALRIDESQLTGESLPISKNSDPIGKDKEVYEQSNMLFQGSFVVAGEGTALVVATANTTQFGKLAALTTNTTAASPVQKKIDKLLSQIIAVVAGMAIISFVLAIMGGMEVTESIKFVMALSVSAVPESLPVAISVVLVLGMRRMAARKALVRTMRAIETVGVITTIATDKTGTLTKNKLSVQELWPMPGADRALPSIIRLAVNHSVKKSHDPLDIALDEYCELHKLAGRKQGALHVLPFDQDMAMSGNVWHDGRTYELAIKGAPEHVLARSDLSESEHEQATVALHQLTSRGYRVIALATVPLNRESTAFSELPKRARFTFAGFIAVADILRPEAKRSIAAAQAAGVTVRMITGDHFETAYHIGRELGMVEHREQVFDCRRLGTMSDEALEKVIDNIRVFSRVIPEHKYRILALLKQHNITAMTGDGVNDVPALVNAHVGVAMGSGAQIAKDAGDIILLDDNFKSIIDAMREGRAIFANIRRMLFYLLSTNAGEAITMMGALAIGLPVPLVPVQILWVNLVTDTSMVIPLGLEPGEASNMKMKPKKPNAPILSPYMISRIFLVALSMATLTLSLYIFFEQRYGHEYARTIAFCALVVMQWANAFNARSDFESVFKRLFVWNGKFYAGLAIAVALQLLAIVGPLQPVLHVTPVAFGDLIITGTIAFIIPIVLCEIHKFFGRRRQHLLQ